LALPVLSALRRSFPDAKISWLVRSKFAALIENHPHLNEVILFDRKLLGRAWYNRAAFGALVRLIDRLRQSKFDCVIDLQGLFRTAALSWLSGCRQRYGMANAREFGHIFYTKKIAQNKDCIHLVDYYLKIAKAAGAVDSKVEFLLPEDVSATKSVKKLLANCSVDLGNYVVFVPGSAHKSKRWPLERFAVLADKIRAQYNLAVIAVGSKSEVNTIERMKSLAEAEIANLAGQTDLRELTALLRGARLVVSNDTGPGHIAAALGVPLALMFGWSNPARIAPYRRSDCLIAANNESRGRKIKSFKPAHSVNAITVDQVWEKVCLQLQ